MMQIDTILELCEDIRLKGRHRQKRSLEAQADPFSRLKKEAKIFRINSVISQILHWLDWNRQLWSKDIY